MRPVDVNPPRPVEGRHVVYAADQPEYQPLPAWRHADGRLVTRWRLTWRERLAALMGRDLFMEVLTFGQPLQPLYPSWDWGEIEAAALKEQPRAALASPEEEKPRISPATRERVEREMKNDLWARLGEEHRDD